MQTRTSSHKEDNIADTSFAIAEAGACGLTLCLSCQSSSTYSVSRSCSASRLFVLLITGYISATLPAYEPSARIPNKFSARRGEKQKHTKKIKALRKGSLHHYFKNRVFIHACVSLKAKGGRGLQQLASDGRENH